MSRHIQRSSRVVVGFVATLVVAGIAMLTLCVHQFGFGFTDLGSRWPELVLLALLVCATEFKPITIARAGGLDDIVASTTFAFAIFLTFGPVPAMLAQALASVVADISIRKPPIRAAFNVAQYWLSFGAAAFAFLAVSPHPTPFVTGDLTARWQLAVVLAGLSYFIVNNVLVGTAVGLHDGAPVAASIWSMIAGESTSNFVMLALAPILTMIGTQSLIALPVLLLPIFAVYRSTTISAEKQHLALHDPLTDLPNRFHFSTLLSKRIAQGSARSGAAVLLIDLDHFKEINDTLGHQAGDALLKLIGPRIVDAMPPGGSVARLGGDEFAVLLPELADDHDAIAIARKIAKELDRPFSVAGFNIEVEGSIGVALYPNDGSNSESLVKRADVAMYLAKARRTIVERYDPQLDHHSTRRLEMVSELRTAIADNDIVLYYQPKLNLSTGQIGEVEALIRWVHPKLGIVTPSEFVPIAEHTGLIRPLTTHVLAQAAGQAAKWQRDGMPLTVAVNLSARSLHDGAIVQEVLAALDVSGLPPSMLRLEITESSIMADPNRARRVLEQLDDMGIRLAIDDFGTGYSSLAYLQDLPVSEIKIDQSFVTNLLDREGDKVIVRSTIDLAHNLGLTCVAEGVESAAALRWLTRAGCDQAQGFHIARPMTAAGLDEWLVGHRDSVVVGDKVANVLPFKLHVT
jgi:diguanylate cyclase (GGDEF)-like protein